MYLIILLVIINFSTDHDSICYQCRISISGDQYNGANVFDIHHIIHVGVFTSLKSMYEVQTIRQTIFNICLEPSY